MTFSASLQHVPFKEGRVLLLNEWSEALAIAQQDPVNYILAITHLERGVIQGIEAGEVWAFPAVGPIEAVCWMGANLIPIVPDYEAQRSLTHNALSAFAAMAAISRRRSSSIVGPRELVLKLWDLLEPNWRTPREIRASQPSMVASNDSNIAADPFVRLANWDEFDQVLPASVHMFIEEVGVSPLTFGSAQYSMRVRELIADQRTLIRMSSSLFENKESDVSGFGMPGDQILSVDPNVSDQLPSASWPVQKRESSHMEGKLPTRDSVAFKADFGAVIPQVAQVQGVWVNPQFRGLGLSAPAMASVVRYGLTNLAPMVSLYVNDYNTRAIATYKRVGFEQVGEYATVLF